MGLGILSKTTTHIKVKRRFIMESTELEVTGAVGVQILPPPAPASATVDIPANSNVANIAVTLTPVADGQPPITAVEVFHDTVSHAGQTADELRAAGLIPITAPVSGPTVDVVVPDLPWNTPQVFFDIFSVA